MHLILFGIVGTNKSFEISPASILRIRQPILQLWLWLDALAHVIGKFDRYPCEEEKKYFTV